MDLDLKVVRPGEIRMTAGAALVDACGESTHLGDSLSNFLAKQNAPTTRLGTLANYHFDSVGTKRLLVRYARLRRDFD